MCSLFVHINCLLWAFDTHIHDKSSRVSFSFCTAHTRETTSIYIYVTARVNCGSPRMFYAWKIIFAFSLILCANREFLCTHRRRRRHRQEIELEFYVYDTFSFDELKLHQCHGVCTNVRVCASVIHRQFTCNRRAIFYQQQKICVYKMKRCSESNSKTIHTHIDDHSVTELLSSHIFNETNIFVNLIGFMSHCANVHLLYAMDIKVIVHVTVAPSSLPLSHSLFFCSNF